MFSHSGAAVVTTHGREGQHCAPRGTAAVAQAGHRVKGQVVVAVHGCTGHLAVADGLEDRPLVLIAPDGNQTADVVTAVTDTPVIQQQIAGLADGGIYTSYVWARVASGTRKVSVAIVSNAYATYLAGPTQVTLTTSWQRFKISGTLASGQTGLWIVVRQFAANNDDWTTGAIHLWGACLQQGSDPQKAYARTWASHTPHLASGVAAGPTVIAAIDNTTSPLKIHGPGPDLADSTLLELTANGELILAGGSGNDYRFAELMGASNPSGWSGVLNVKTLAGATLGYILLYSSP